jgi:hypothetical protein
LASNMLPSRKPSWFTSSMALTVSSLHGAAIWVDRYTEKKNNLGRNCWRTAG